jgi:mRNA interferase YafQ
MRKLVWGASFRRAFKKAARKKPDLSEAILEVIERLARDPFEPLLKTHKLQGQLQGLWACWVEYDCRIVLSFQQDTDTGQEVIVLIDIGTHDEVY